jgi:uncharacterized protein YjbJ (UPF0337 family)
MKKDPSFEVKSGSQDEVEGTTRNLVGKVRETAGKAVGNPGLEARGDIDQVIGQSQKKIGEIKKALGT